MASLELYASPPGTGKTTRCIEVYQAQILRSRSGLEGRSFFVLPSREHAERVQNLLLKKGVPGLFNAHVLTLQDFARRQSDGLRAERPEDATRDLLIAEVLREGGNRWTWAEPVRNLDGFRTMVAQTILECKASRLDPEAIRSRAARLLRQESFARKLSDFIGIYEGYEAKLNALGLEEPDDALARLAGGEDREWADLVIVDGFYRFTKAQEMLLEAMSRRARRMIVTLTIPEDDERAILFEYPRKTKLFLARAGFAVSSVPAVNRRTRVPALLHLEKSLFRADPKRFEGPSAEAVQEFAADSPRGEIEMIAREIRRLHRESDVHYSDMCVILRSIGRSDRLLGAVFEEFGIPAHLHERLRFGETAFGSTLLKWLAVLEGGWARAEVCAFFESVCVAGAHGASWAEALRRAAAAAAVREGREAWGALCAALSSPAELKISLRAHLEAAEKFEQAETAASYAAALRASISLWRAADHEAESLARERLDEIVERLPRTADGARARSAFLIKTLRTALFSLRPSGRNRVQVYDVVMALPKEYKVVFVAGLLEGVFPQNPREDPVFKDDEREEINRRGIALEERRWRSGGERYFFFMAVTRAKERLYLTHARFDGEGRPALASFFIEDVRRCFAAGALRLRERGAGEMLLPPEQWEIEKDADRSLAADPGRALRSEPFIRERIRRSAFLEILRAARETERAFAVSDPRYLEELARRRVFGVSAVETYRACPFRYFVSRILRVDPDEGMSEAAADGKILHRVLELFYRERSSLADLGSDLESVRARLRTLLENEMAAQPPDEAPRWRRALRRERLGETLDRFARRERELAAVRTLEPAFFEWVFGDEPGAHGPALTLGPPGGEFRVRGRVDRIDLSPKKDAAFVIDYKKSGDGGSFGRQLAEGVALQLPAYVMAVTRHLGLHPAGAELRSLEKGSERGLYPEASLALHGERRKKCSDGEFEAVLKRAETCFKEAVAGIRSGDFTVAPRTCQHCEYGAVCRIEPWKKRGGL